MIPPFHSTFLTPTRAFRRLSVLLAIHESPRTSQHQIARKSHLSSSMVNNYIKELKKTELIQVTGKTNRTQRYHLTDEGEEMLLSSLMKYSAEIVLLYRAVKLEVAGLADRFISEGIRTLVMFGAAETAEVVLAALKETSLKIIGVVDSDPAKQGKPFDGMSIDAPERLNQLRPDAILITSFGRQEEIYDYIREHISASIPIKKLGTLEP